MKLIAHVARTPAGPVVLAMATVPDDTPLFSLMLEAAQKAKYVQHDLSTAVEGPVNTPLDVLTSKAMADMIGVTEAFARDSEAAKGQ